MSKAKLARNTMPEGFTLSLALFDALPVLFFGVSTVLMGMVLGVILAAVLR